MRALVTGILLATLAQVPLPLPLPSGRAGGGGPVKKVTNLLRNSNAFNSSPWEHGAGTVTDASASCPSTPGGRAMALVAIPYPYSLDQNVTNGTARSLYVATATGDSPCSIRVADYTGANWATVFVTATPTRYGTHVAGNHGISIYSPNGGCSRWCVGDAQAENATKVGFFCGPTGASAKTCFISSD